MKLNAPNVDEPEFSVDTAALGRIDSLTLTIGRMEKLAKAESDTSTSFLNSLIATVGRRADVDDLEHQDVRKLSDAERDEFARRFLDNNQYLFRENVSEERQHDDGHLVLSSTLGDIKHQRSKDESDSDYLFRLFKIQQAEMKDQTRRIVGSLEATVKSKRSLFTPSFLEALRKSQGATAQLANMVDRMRVRLPDTTRLALGRSALESSKSSDIHGPKIHVPDVSTFRNPAHDTNEKLSDVLNTLNSMEDWALQMAETVQSVGNVASQFLVDFGLASDKADYASRRTILISLAAVFLAVLSTLVHIGYSEWRTLRTEANTAAAIHTISTHIEAVAEAQRESMGQIGADLNRGNIATQNSLDQLSTALQGLMELLRAQAIRAPSSGPSSSSG